MLCAKWWPLCIGLSALITDEQVNFISPTMHRSHIPQYIIQNRNEHISVLNGALWENEEVHGGFCDFGLLWHSTGGN